MTKNISPKIDIRKSEILSKKESVDMQASPKNSTLNNTNTSVSFSPNSIVKDKKMSCLNSINKLEMEFIPDSTPSSQMKPIYDRLKGRMSGFHNKDFLKQNSNQLENLNNLTNYTSKTPGVILSKRTEPISSLSLMPERSPVASIKRPESITDINLGNGSNQMAVKSIRKPITETYILQKTLVGSSSSPVSTFKSQNSKATKDTQSNQQSPTHQPNQPSQSSFKQPRLTGNIIYFYL